MKGGWEMSTTSIRDSRMVPYEQYAQARRLLVDALFIGTFDKTTLGRKIRRFLDQENSSGEAASWVAGDIVSEWCEDQYTNVLA
jgi:hypothetical protein